MFKMTKLGRTFGILVSSAFFIYGCGGGGGGGSNTPSAGTATQSSAAASKAITNALGAATTGTSGVSGKPSLKTKPSSGSSDPAQIRQALKNFKSSMEARREKSLQATQNLTCTGGGTQSIQTEDGGTNTDITDDSFTLTATDCTQSGSGSTDFTDGSFSLAPTETGFTITFNDFLTRFTETASGRVEESFVDGTITFSGDDVGCGTESFLTSGTITINANGYDKVDETGNGTFEINESWVFNNLAMAVSELFTQNTQAGQTSCDPGATTLTLNGGMTLTDNVDGDNTFSATFTNFQTVLTPATRGGVEGETLSVNGTIAISSDCANGTFTLSTPAGEEPFFPDDSDEDDEDLFFPDDSDEDCPTNGTILITGGGTTTAVKYTSTGGIQIDEGNNGSVEKEFADCVEAEVCA